MKYQVPVWVYMLLCRLGFHIKLTHSVMTGTDYCACREVKW